MKRFAILILLFGFSQGAFGDELVAYTRYIDKYWQIWVYNITDGTNEQVTQSPYDKKTPVWSPDSKEILYRTSNGEFFVIDMDSKQEKRILEKINYCADPDWISTDEILFTRYRTDVIDDSDIWLVNLKTGERKVLVSEKGLQYSPTLSSDRAKLVYVDGQAPKDHRIILKDLVSNKKRQLTQDEGFHTMPALSLNNEKIVFVSDSTGDNEIWYLEINTSETKQLTKNQGLDSDPKWIRDGEEIIYSSYQEGKFQINTLDINRLEIKPLIALESDCCNPDWIKK